MAGHSWDLTTFDKLIKKFRMSVGYYLYIYNEMGFRKIQRLYD